MKHTETLGALTKALVAVQAGLRPAKKDSTNPFFDASYADLNSVWDSCRELLTKNGLAVTQTNEVTPDGVIVETTLLHDSGEWLSGQLYLPLAKRDPQGVGSAITYGRRYGLSAILGIVADEDDDGNAASPKQPEKMTRAQGLTIKKIADEAEMASDTLAEFIKNTVGVEDKTKITQEQAGEIIYALKNRKK